MPTLHKDEAASSAGLPCEITHLPILILNVHSRCNCRCVMCDIWKRETGAEINAADLERHRESLRNLGVRQVVLTGGEPLLHSHLHALCSFFQRENIELTLLTTGLLLLKRAQEVADFFDSVIVSLDGPAKVHDKVRRVNGAFDIIRRGVTAVHQNRPQLQIAGRCTVQKANCCLLRSTVAAAQEMGLDSISFLAADLSSEAFNRPSAWPVQRQNEVALTAAEVDELDNEMEQLIATCAEDIERGYIVENPAKLRRIVRHFRAHLGQVAHDAPQCNAPWVSAVVEVDGSLRPCFFHRTIGEIHSTSLECAINGEAARSFRKSLDIAGNPTCRRCVCSLNYRLD